MNWPEAKEYLSKNDIVIFPVGSNEQHGPANPLGTDHLIARSIAEDAAKQTGVLCLPVVPFGVSSHHKQFSGTIFISPQGFKKYVKDVCLSLEYLGIRKIVVVNGHGGNLAALSDLARELRKKGVFMSVFQWWHASPKLLPDIFSPDERRHAGAEETSMNLALHPNLVSMDKALDEAPRRHIVQVEGLTLPLSTVDETSSGVFGKQSKASAEKGKMVFESVVKELVRHVNILKNMNTTELDERQKV
jgi:creatinine amidohydrolase